MAGRSRASTKSESTKKSREGQTTASEGDPSQAVATDADSSGSSPSTTGESERFPQTRTTIRLPLLTVTISRTGGGPPSGKQQLALPSLPAIAEDPRAQRFAFFAGAAALGALEVIEWPVAALIAAGTYLASRRRSAPELTEAGSAAGSSGTAAS